MRWANAWTAHMQIDFFYCRNNQFGLFLILTYFSLVFLVARGCGILGPVTSRRDSTVRVEG